MNEKQLRARIAELEEQVASLQLLGGAALDYSTLKQQGDARREAAAKTLSRPWVSTRSEPPGVIEGGFDEARANDALARECDEQVAKLKAEVERWRTAYEGRSKYEDTEEIVRKWTTDPLYVGEVGHGDVLHLCATVNRVSEERDEALRQLHEKLAEARVRDSNLTFHTRNVMAVNEELRAQVAVAGVLRDNKATRAIRAAMALLTVVNQNADHVVQFVRACSDAAEEVERLRKIEGGLVAEDRRVRARTAALVAAGDALRARLKALALLDVDQDAIEHWESVR